jgi:ribosomal protein S12 methylthiotransferase
MREIVPEIAVRTTFIVGFPGEGEAEYEELVQFVREAELDNVGAFAYSPEPGSGSEPLGDPVPAAEKERRREFLLSLQQPISRGRLRRLEGASEESEYLLEGRLRSQAPEIDGRLLITDVADRALSAGDVVSVRIERTFDYDVSGAVVS